jgi:hypothetical protein
MRMAGLLMDPADTTTASLARMMANSPSMLLTSAPMQRRRDAVGVKLARVAGVGEGDEEEAAKRRRSTCVLVKNLAPWRAASLSQLTGPDCFSE